MQASHNPTPSPTCDQRVASSRRPGAAGTAVATKLRALDFHSLFGRCGRCMPVMNFRSSAHSLVTVTAYWSCYMCLAGYAGTAAACSFAHIYTYCIAHSCFLSSCSNAMLMLDPLALIQRFGPLKLFASFCSHGATGQLETSWEPLQYTLQH